MRAVYVLLPLAVLGCQNPGLKPVESSPDTEEPAGADPVQVDPPEVEDEDTDPGEDPCAGDWDGDGINDCDDDCPIFVATDGRVDGAGTPVDPMRYVQDAIDASPAIGCSSIRLQPGTYAEVVDMHTYDLDLGPVVPDSRPTLEGDGTHPVVTIAGGQTASTRVAGLRITGGGGVRGAGLYIEGASPRILDNHIEDNHTTEDLTSTVPVAVSDPLQGGGIYLRDSDAEIRNNLIRDNDAGFGGPEDGSDGGGICVRNGAPRIEGNQITGNTAGDGGGLWFARSDAMVLRNLISGNMADDEESLPGGTGAGGQGGGINVQIGGEDMVIAGNIITHNLASTHGGGVSIYEPTADGESPLVLNNTIAFNTLEQGSYGAGVLARSTTAPRFFSNILYRNDGVGAWLGPNAEFAYNVVFGHAAGDYAGDQTSPTLNYDVDPGFSSVSDDGDWTNDVWTPTSPMSGHPDHPDAGGSAATVGAYGGPWPH